MKKTLLIVSVLLVAVISTACINNFAVRDLNNKAQSYMQKGDYSQAIERLKSSLDLDPTVSNRMNLMCFIHLLLRKITLRQILNRAE